MTVDPFNSIVTPFFIILTILVIMIFLMVYLISHQPEKSGGYGTLVHEWPATHEPTGKKFSHQHLGLGKVLYKNCVTFVSSKEGLFITLGFPFTVVSFINPNVGKSAFIPWGSLCYIQKKRIFWTDVYEYKSQNTKPVILTFLKQVVDSFPEYVKPPT